MKLTNKTMAVGFIFFFKCISNVLYLHGKHHDKDDKEYADLCQINKRWEFFANQPLDNDSCYYGADEYEGFFLILCR